MRKNGGTAQIPLMAASVMTAPISCHKQWKPEGGRWRSAKARIYVTRERIMMFGGSKRMDASTGGDPMFMRATRGAEPRTFISSLRQVVAARTPRRLWI